MSSPLIPQVSQLPPAIDPKSSVSAYNRSMIEDLMGQQKNRLNSDLREYSEVVRETEVISIPDIHGDIFALEMSLEAHGLVDSKGDWVGGNRVIEFLGDYIDRGENALEIIDYLLKLRSQAEKAGGRIDFLLGNHEGMMLASAAGASDKLRNNWLLKNGGSKIFAEIMIKYKLRSADQIWEKMREIFWPGGEYAEFVDSLKLASQVDDVLYVHGGINEKWASIIEKGGVDELNRLWKDALGDLRIGDFSAYNRVAGEGSPVWLRFGEDMQMLSESEVKQIADSLKKRGINAIVVGHDETFLGTPLMSDLFLKYGIKLINANVGMNANESRSPSQGGVKIDTKGNIVGRSRYGDTVLHEEAEAAPESVAA